MFRKFYSVPSNYNRKCYLSQFGSNGYVAFCDETLHIQGGPEKTAQPISHGLFLQWMVSVDEVISSEKNDTKIRKFGWAVFSL